MLRLSTTGYRLPTLQSHQSMLQSCAITIGKLEAKDTMPIIKSAKKRVRIAHKAAARNARTKRSLKAALKVLRAKTSNEALRKAQSTLDVAVKKGIMHKNKAARKKRQLAAMGKSAGIKLTAKPITKKTPVKKAVPSKKPAAKKAAPAKKTTAKKSVAKKSSKK